MPQDSGVRGSRNVYVRGLTTVDFPLGEFEGNIDTIRRTTLIIGNVRVDKVVSVTDGGYIVKLKITSPSALEDFKLTDPLPDGAVLKEGSNILIAKLPAGETNLTYRFDWTGEPRAATTDPIMSWRY